LCHALRGAIPYLYQGKSLQRKRKEKVGVVFEVSFRVEKDGGRGRFSSQGNERRGRGDCTDEIGGKKGEGGARGEKGEGD